MQRLVLVLALGALGCGGGDGGGPPTVVGDGGVGGSGGAATTPKIAFVTSTEYTSAFATIGEADAQCQARAAEAKLSGSFRAWISDASSSPATRFVHAEGNYVSVEGTLIAKGWSGLTSGSLVSTIDYDEHSEQTTIGLETWTGTAADGTSTGVDCDGWSGSGQATVGNITAYGAKWTEALSGDCDGFRHLYCFEQ